MLPVCIQQCIHIHSFLYWEQIKNLIEGTLKIVYNVKILKLLKYSLQNPFPLKNIFFFFFMQNMTEILRVQTHKFGIFENSPFQICMHTTYINFEQRTFYSHL